MPATRPRTVLFRASATAATGGGHVVRCLALADELVARGWRAVFAAGPESKAIVPALAGFPLIEVDERAGDDEPVEAEHLGHRLGGPVDLAVVDHYGRGRAFETGLRAFSPCVLAIDDLLRDHDADLLLDQNGGRSAADYAGRVPDHCRVLAGPSFALLRPAFRLANPAERTGRGTIGRIVVQMGATDATDLTGPAVAVLRAAVPGATIDIILAAAAPHAGDLARRWADDSKVVLHLDPPDIAAIVGRADLAVGTAGIGLWERCALGVPTLIVVAAENQRMNALHAERKGGGEIVATDGRIDADRLAGSLKALMDDPNRLAALAANARCMCDGLGAIRVADELEKLLGDEPPGNE